MEYLCKRFVVEHGKLNVWGSAISNFKLCDSFILCDTIFNPFIGVCRYPKNRAVTEPREFQTLRFVWTIKRTNYCIHYMRIRNAIKLQTADIIIAHKKRYLLCFCSAMPSHAPCIFGELCKHMFESCILCS